MLAGVAVGQQGVPEGVGDWGKGHLDRSVKPLEKGAGRGEVAAGDLL